MRRLGKGGVFLASFFLLFGVGALYGAFDAYRTAVASREWKSVEGEIIEASFWETSTGSRKAQTARTYAPQWRYRYEVDGSRYTSSRIRAGELVRSYPTEEEARRAARARYPVGMPVRVFYDPADPSSAVLVRGEASPEGMATLLATGILMLGFAAVLLAVFPAGAPVPRLAVCTSCQCEYPSELRTRDRLCPACRGAA